MRRRLDLSINATTGKEHAAFLRRRLKQAHRMVRWAPAELSIALVGDRTMSKLHESYLGIPGSTDVLTFPLEHDSSGRISAGEVVICVPEARRQAARRGLKPSKELLLYALHGILHLSGFDDRTEKASRQMHTTEDKLLMRLGVGKVFASSNARGRRSAD